MVALCPAIAVAAYRPRQPRASALWKCVREHFDEFTMGYDEQCQSKYGPLRPVVQDVVRRFLECGDLHEGFARVRCPLCCLEYLLAFSCKTRGFCPTCQQRRTAQTARVLVEDVFATVPHCHYVLSLPVAVRGFFQRDRSLFKDLCRLANASLREWMQTALNQPDGQFRLETGDRRL